MPWPSSYQRRRRASASSGCHSSSGPIPLREKTSTSCPITITRAFDTASGRRRIAYRNAPRSSSCEPASACRLELIERCDGSSTRSSVSPLERSSVVYVRW